MRKMVDLMLGRMAFLLGLLWLSALSAMHLWPASWWLEIDSVRVADGIEGKPVLMHVERTIHRDFTGTWGCVGAQSDSSRIDGSVRSQCRDRLPNRR